MTKDYFEKLTHPNWQKKRLEIFERDGWICQNCGNDQETLMVHHKKYSKEYRDPWEYPDHFLVTLCKTCHDNMYNPDDYLDSIHTHFKALFEKKVIKSEDLQSLLFILYTKEDTEILRIFLRLFPISAGAEIQRDKFIKLIGYLRSRSMRKLIFQTIDEYEKKIKEKEPDLLKIISSFQEEADTI